MAANTIAGISKAITIVIRTNSLIAAKCSVNSPVMNAAVPKYAAIAAKYKSARFLWCGTGEGDRAGVVSV